MTPSTPTGDRPRVLILGGGFGGSAPRASSRTRPPTSSSSTATTTTRSSRCCTRLRPTCWSRRRSPTHSATSSTTSPTPACTRQPRPRSTSQARRVEFDRMDPIDYDYLVIALGAQVSFFGVDGASDHAFPMYTLEDALRLKEHVLRRWEAADRDPSLVEDGALRIVVVGGGPTGVESVGALGRALPQRLRQGLSESPPKHATLTDRRGGERPVLDVRAGSSAATRRRRSKSAGSRSCSGRSSPRSSRRASP